MYRVRLRQWCDEHEKKRRVIAPRTSKAQLQILYSASSIVIFKPFLSHSEVRHHDKTEEATIRLSPARHIYLLESTEVKKVIAETSITLSSRIIFDTTLSRHGLGTSISLSLHWIKAYTRNPFRLTATGYQITVFLNSTWR